MKTKLVIFLKTPGQPRDPDLATMKYM